MYDPNDLNNKEPSYISFGTFEVIGVITFIVIVIIGVVAGALMGQLLSGLLISLGVSFVVYGIMFMGSRK